MVSINPFDKLSLSRDSYLKTKEIGARLLERLEEEWSEEKKMDILFPDPEYDFYLTGKEQRQLLVRRYIDELPDDDPDMVAYRNVHKRDQEEYRASRQKAKNRRGRKRYNERHRNKASGNYRPPAVPLPGIPQNA